jgi:SAM-dependent methyltransferase
VLFILHEVLIMVRTTRPTAAPISNMAVDCPANPYALGNTDAEHERLIRQAACLAPYTERFFRRAGLGPGQRVLDLGSGVGDVAMLVASIVGPAGEVVGIERDTSSIERARARVAEAGLRNVSFAQSDASLISSSKSFDAAVGRFILMFLPNPVAVLDSVCKLIRSGGVVAFQEPFWTVRHLWAHLPLWSKAASLIVETFRSCGANPEIGLALYGVFQDAGLPPPEMHMEVLLGNDTGSMEWLRDILCSLRPQIDQHNLPLAPLGDLDSLPARLSAELVAGNTVAPWLAIVGACSRKPESP